MMKLQARISPVDLNLAHQALILLDELRMGTDCHAYLSGDDRFITVEPTEMFPWLAIKRWMEQKCLTEIRLIS